MQSSILKLYFLDLPLPIISMVCDFLKIKDINRIASTCRTLHTFLFINVENYEKNTLHNEKAVTGSLFWSINIKKEKNFHETTKILKMIKFIFITKEQAYGDFHESTSWIQAEFLQKKGESLLAQQKCTNTQKNRYRLISNYCNYNYQPKVFYLSDDTILNDLERIEIYLRTRYQKQFMYCKRADIKMIYCYDDIRIKPQQLKQRIKCNRKNSILTY